MNLNITYRTRPSSAFKSLPLDLEALQNTTLAPVHPRHNPDGKLTYGDLARQEFIGTIKDSDTVTIWCNSAEDIASADTLSADIQSIGNFEYVQKDEVKSLDRRNGGTRESTKYTLSHTKPKGLSTEEFSFLRSVLKGAIAPK